MEQVDNSKKSKKKKKELERVKMIAQRRGWREVSRPGAKSATHHRTSWLRNSLCRKELWDYGGPQIQRNAALGPTHSTGEALTGSCSNPGVGATV